MVLQGMTITIQGFSSCSVVVCSSVVSWPPARLACLAIPTSDFPTTPCVLQMRVINAFKSTLEDLQERRSVRSLHSLRSSRSSHPLSDIKYIDEDPKTPSPLSSNNTVRMVSPAEDPHLVPLQAQGGKHAAPPPSLHTETSI